MSRRRGGGCRAGVAGMTLLLWCATAVADTAAADTSGADATPAPAKTTAGEVLAASCYGCHATEEIGDATIPGLQGLTRAVIVQRLNAYRSDAIEGTVMNRLAKGYTTQEIELLAQTLSGETP